MFKSPIASTLAIASAIPLIINSSALAAPVKNPANKQQKSEASKPTAKIALASPADRKYDEGWEAMRQRRWPVALEAFKAGLALDPKSAKCNFGMAALERHRATPQQLITWLSTAIAKDPKYEEAIKLRGEIYVEDQEYESAIKDFSRLIELKPKVAEFICLRGLQYFEIGDLDNARADLIKGYTINPDDPTALLLRATIEYYDCKYKIAAACCSKALNLWNGGDSGELYYLRSQANMRLFDFAAAKADLKLADSMHHYNYSYHQKPKLDDLEYDHRNAEKDPALRFALALTMPMFELNNQGSESLPGMIVNAENADKERYMVGASRNVHNRAELLEHFKNQQQLGNNLRWQQLRKQGAKGKTSDPQVKLVQQYGAQYGDRGILGWDLSREIALCRWAFVCGWLSRDEAIARILPLAARIQKLYGGWEQFVTEYYVGRRFWNEEKHMDEIGRVNRTAHRILSDPNGVKKIPWNTPIKGGAAL